MTVRALAALTLAVAALSQLVGSLVASRQALEARAPDPMRQGAVQNVRAHLIARPPLGLDLYRPIPGDNPLSAEKVALGRRLFHDQRLSQSGTISCASCHDPARAFTNGRPVAAGIGGVLGHRNVPTIVNRVYGTSFFWDGRAASLEEQAAQPLLDAREMATTPEAVVAIVRRDASHGAAFQAAFGRPPEWDDVLRALASYVRTVRSGDSPYDRFVMGDAAALSTREQRGWHLFFGSANCASCHRGPNFTDERFHNTGVAYRDGELTDPGRFTATSRPADRGAFKTPTLREIARTAPYMHDGSLATLDDVVEFYDRGGIPNPGLDRHIRPLDLLSEDRAALVAFLRALNGSVREGR